MKKLIVITTVAALTLLLIGGSGSAMSPGLKGAGERISSGLQIIVQQGPAAAWNALRGNIEALGNSVKTKTGL